MLKRMSCTTTRDWLWPRSWETVEGSVSASSQSSLEIAHVLAIRLLSAQPHRMQVGSSSWTKRPRHRGQAG